MSTDIFSILAKILNFGNFLTDDELSQIKKLDKNIEDAYAEIDRIQKKYRKEKLPGKMNSMLVKAQREYEKDKKEREAAIKDSFKNNNSKKK